MAVNSRIALVTVSTANYFQWTMTMLFSFLQSNPWFNGEIRVISHDLGDDAFPGEHVFPGLSVIRPSRDLVSRLQVLGMEIPSLSDKLARFYALEMFNIQEFDRLIFLDSDTVVVGSLEPLLELPEGFYACSEWFSGKARRFSDFASIEAGNASENDIKTPVNTGFMMISEAFLTRKTYSHLLDFITPDHWANSDTSLTDQLIINKYFHKEIKVISSRYNYRPKNAAGILRAENLKLEDAVVIHYLLKAKPWNFQEVWPTSSTSLEMLKACEIWYNSYFDLLAHLHLDHSIKLMSNYANQP